MDRFHPSAGHGPHPAPAPPPLADGAGRSAGGRDLLPDLPARPAHGRRHGGQAGGGLRHSPGGLSLAGPAAVHKIRGGLFRHLHAVCRHGRRVVLLRRAPGLLRGGRRGVLRRLSADPRAADRGELRRPVPVRPVYPQKGAFGPGLPPAGDLRRADGGGARPVRQRQQPDRTVFRQPGGGGPPRRAGERPARRGAGGTPGSGRLRLRRGRGWKRRRGRRGAQPFTAGTLPLGGGRRVAARLPPGASDRGGGKRREPGRHWCLCGRLRGTGPGGLRRAGGHRHRRPVRRAAGEIRELSAHRRAFI